LTTIHRSSRGIGLEIVTQLLSVPSNTIFATCRNPDTASALQLLKQKSDARLHIVKLDVDDEKSIKDAAGIVEKMLGERGVDYLLNNAGIVSQQHIRSTPS
jgi:NAD(P)-dependent dehydrogenase (short-subunit alcohol dehydrogenase family)